MGHIPQGWRVKEKEGAGETGGQKGKVREQEMKEGKEGRNLLGVQAKRSAFK